MSEDKKLSAKLTAGRSGRLSSYAAILLVSVGKQNFEGEAIRSAIQMVNAEFPECYIIIADTLQRHNLVAEKGIDRTDAHNLALQAGNEWLKRYEKVFKDYFSIPYEIVRWDNIITDPSFREKENNFYAYLNANANTSAAMTASILEYGERLQKRLGDEAFNKIAESHESNCFSYLKEECAAIALFPKKIKTHRPLVIVYPGKSTAILNENRSIFLEKEYSEHIKMHQDFLNWVPYRFVTMKNNKEKPDYNDTLNKEIKHAQNSMQIEKINDIIEQQLQVFDDYLDEVSLFQFRHYLLDFILKKDIFYPESNKARLSIEKTAFIFSNQLNIMFNTMEEKLSKQCRANVVRILKRLTLIPSILEPGNNLEQKAF